MQWDVKTNKYAQDNTVFQEKMEVICSLKLINKILSEEKVQMHIW